MSRASILYVIPALGGPPPEFALPRLRRHGDVHALLFAPPSPAVEPLLRGWCTSLRCLRPDAVMPDAIVDAARQVRADAVVAFSEFAIVAVAAACQQLGLRGPGPNVVRSRDKVEMRSIWQQHGLPGPAFVPVRSLADLHRAGGELRKPFLLKPSWLAGSQGQVIIHETTDLGAAWRTATTAIEEMDRIRLHDCMSLGRGTQFIAEEIIEATTESWYDVEGYGDYVSVEGVVVGGRYFPISITARLPTIPPFVELSFHAPTVLSAEKQRRIEALARAAVDSLGLDFCGTHTEVKLQRDGGLCLIENAARLGGAMIPRLVYEAFQVDLIDLLTRALLGEPLQIPEPMLTSTGSGTAVASLMMIATDAQGRPWTAHPEFLPDRVDWERLTGPDTQVEVVWSQTRPSGSPMPVFSSTAGTRNYAGTLLLRGSHPLALQRDCYRILDGLEVALKEAALRRDAPHNVISVASHGVANATADATP